jgi:hypothetical protein
MNKMTPEQYRSLIHKGKSEAKWSNPEPVKKKGGKKKESSKMDTVQALKAMGNYFELDPKKVNFVISQWKLSGKI